MSIVQIISGFAVGFAAFRLPAPYGEALLISYSLAVLYMFAHNGE